MYEVQAGFQIVAMSLLRVRTIFCVLELAAAFAA